MAFFPWQQGLTTRYDEGNWFRRQEPRTLDDIDLLVQRMQLARQKIGLERAAEIERRPEAFADGESFRIQHAKARQNCILFTALSYFVGITTLNLFMPQLQANKLARTYRPLVVLGCLGYAVFTYQIFSRLAGFNPQKWREYNFAKMVRQLRNVQIKQ